MDELIGKYVRLFFDDGDSYIGAVVEAFFVVDHETWIKFSNRNGDFTIMRLSDFSSIECFASEQ